MATTLALLSASGQVEFTGVGEHHVIEVIPETTTGLDRIYVVFDTDGVGMTFGLSTGEPAVWESFDYPDGSLVIEPVTDIRWNGAATTLRQVKSDIGYKIQDGSNRPFYCWVVNYADYFLELNDMFIVDEASCNLITFNIDGHGDAIPYYTVDGHHKVLDREIVLTYNTLVWDGEGDMKWKEKQVSETFESLEDGIMVAPPLCNTEFKLFGDRFLKEWNMEVGIEGTGGTYLYTQAVGCATTAFYLDENGNFILDDEGNKTKLEGELTGGSAPVRILFTGYPTDAVAYRKWEMATDPDFESVFLQYNQDEVDYTFTDAGTYYMRYMVANASGSCEAYGDTYMINVSESDLKCPNVFSPGSTEGVNDIWKVAYKSLVEFHCWIFNRWGALVCEFTDPSDGWDGTYNGKLVDTGVYYYVVTALGSDGVKYKKRGDITILRYKKGAAGTSNGVDAGGGY